MHFEAIEMYQLNANDFAIDSIKSGLINDTWSVTSVKEASKKYILQRVNNAVFRNPEDIDFNIRLLSDFLKVNSNNYIFPCLVKTFSGLSLITTSNNDYFRMFNYVLDSLSYTSLNNSSLAYEAAKQFGDFTWQLRGLDPFQLKITLPNFHNLSMRYYKYLETLDKCKIAQRLQYAATTIKVVSHYRNIVSVYENDIVQSSDFKVRVVHHDTKASNVLFDSTGKGICVIDLDTVMAGYFISDIGDMIRSYACSGGGEEDNDIDGVVLPNDINENKAIQQSSKELSNWNIYDNHMNACGSPPLILSTSSKVIRIDFIEAIVRGYLSSMRGLLTNTELTYITYAGKFMIYMQAIRFLTDYLDGDRYYKTSYTHQNLYRAIQQLLLLQQYSFHEVEIKMRINDIIANEV